MKRFVKTSDRETAEKLRELGLVCLGERNGVWTFLNNDAEKIDGLDNVNFSNKLFV